jgi:hypothetical protein
MGELFGSWDDDQLGDDMDADSIMSDRAFSDFALDDPYGNMTVAIGPYAINDPEKW